MENQNSQQDIQAEILYAHVKELSQMKYESELRREDSLIQQSSNMQTAFSFSTAALFMIAPITIEYRGNLSINFFLIVFSSITASLLLSLLFASFAQKRHLNTTFPDVVVIEKEVSDNFGVLITKAQQYKQWVDLIGKVQKSKSEINDKRVSWIRWSMWLFYLAIALSAFWFVVAICKMI